MAKNFTINEKEKYFYEFSRDLAERMGTDNDIRASVLARALYENLNDNDSKNAFEKINNLTNLNNFKNNINKIEEHLTKSEELKEFNENFKAEANNLINKFRKDFIKNRDTRKNLESKITKIYKSKIEKLEERLQFIASSSDKRVTRWEEHTQEKLRETIKDRDLSFNKVKNNFENGTHTKFVALKNEINDKLEKGFGFRLDNANDTLNLNLTSKSIKPRDAKLVAEAYQMNLHKLDSKDLMDSKKELFNNVVFKIRMINRLKKELNLEYEEKEFTKVNKDLFRGLEHLAYKTMTIGLPRNFEENGELVATYKKEIKKLVVESINEFKMSKEPLKNIELEKLLKIEAYKEVNNKTEELRKEKERVKFLEDFILKQNLEVPVLKEPIFVKNEESILKREKKLFSNVHLKINKKIEVLKNLEDKAEQKQGIKKLRELVTKLESVEVKVITFRKISDLEEELKLKNEIEIVFEKPKKAKEVEPKEVEPKEVEPKEVEPKEVEPKEVEPKEVKNVDEEGDNNDFNR